MRKKRSVFCPFVVFIILSGLLVLSKSNPGALTLDTEEFEITWMVNKPVTTPTFPIFFTTRKNATNVSFFTSWGFNDTLALSPWAERLYWFQTPVSSDGSGNISFFVENNLVALYNLSWVSPPLPVDEPLQLKLVYDWFSYWIGMSRLSAIYSTNGSVFITYEFLDYGYNYQYQYPESFLYPSPFSLRVNVSPSGWAESCDYLHDNLAHRWQSWSYRSLHAMCDGGGYRKTLSISWNSTAQTAVSKMFDDDSCSGRRICTIPVVNTFLNSLLDLTTTLISQSLNHSTTSSVPLESNITETSDFVSRMTHKSSVPVTTEPTSRITFNSGFIPILAILVLISVIRGYKSFFKE